MLCSAEWCSESGEVVAYSLPTLVHIKVHPPPFSLTNRCCMGDDSITTHVRMTSVNMIFSPPDNWWAGSAAGHPSKQVVPVPCGSCERARDERLHGTQQALPILERLVFICYIWYSPSIHSDVECNLICLLLQQKVFNRWVFGWFCHWL